MIIRGTQSRESIWINGSVNSFCFREFMDISRGVNHQFMSADFTLREFMSYWVIL